MSHRIVSFVLSLIAFASLARSQPVVSNTYRVGQIPTTVNVYLDQSVDMLIQTTALGGTVKADTSNFGANRGTMGAVQNASNIKFTYKPVAGDKDFNVVFTATAPNASVATETVKFHPLTIFRPEQDFIPPTLVLPEDASYTKYKDIRNADGRRSAEISGRTVIIEPGSKEYQLLNCVEPSPNCDVSSLKIYAETLIIRDHLWVNSAAVSIFAREMRFEPPTSNPKGDSFLSVSGRDASQLQPAQFGNGADGASAGNITLRVRDMTIFTSGNIFYLNGGRGQDAGAGKRGQDGASHLLAPLPPASFTLNGPSSGVGGATTARCVFNNPTYDTDHTIWVDFSCEGRVVNLQAGENFFPTSGTDGTPGGRPGRGGNGGVFTAIFEKAPGIASSVSRIGGSNGNRAATAFGGTAGTPTLAQRVHFVGTVSSRDFLGFPTGYSLSVNSDSQNSSNGKDAPGPAASGTPSAGAYTPQAEQPLTWLHPLSARTVLDYMRDLYRAGNLPLARSIGADYLPLFQQRAADAANPDRGDFSQNQMECEQMIQRLDANLDFYGNPAGWVPLLSLSANMSLLDSEVKASAPMLYLSYWIENYANDINQSLQAANASHDALWADIQRAQQTYKDAVSNIPALQNSANSIQGDINTYRDLLKSRATVLSQQATATVQEKNKLSDWQKALRIMSAIASVIPIDQPALGAIGAGLDFATTVNPDDPIGAAQGAFSLASSFASTEFNQANTALNSPLAALGPEGAAASAAIGNITDSLGKMSGAIDKIRTTLGPPAAPQNEVDAELKRIEALDPSFQDFVKQLTDLNTRKAGVTKSIVTLTDNMAQASQTISANLLTLAEVDKVRQGAVKTFDLRGVNQVRAMGRRAQERLEKYLYYMAKSYEYTLLQPYPGDLNMSSVVTQLQQLATNAKFTGPADTAIVEPYRQAIRDVISKGVDSITHLGAPSKDNLSFLLTADELNTLNTNREVVIDLAGKLPSVGGNEVKLLNNVQISQNSGDGFKVSPANATNPITVNFWTTGNSVLTSTVNITSSQQFAYAFRFGTVDNPDPFNWRDTWDPSRANPLNHAQPSAQTLELLKTFLNNNLGGVSEANLPAFFFSNPSADSLLRIRRNEGAAQITSLRVSIDLTSYAPSVRYGILNLRAPVVGAPVVTLNRADVTGRAAGKGSFKRVYQTGTNVTLSVDNNYGGLTFQKWVNGEGTQLGTSTSLSLTLNDFSTVQPVYTTPTVAPATFTLSGIVSDSKNACASGVKVSLTATNSVTTGADGKYSIGNLTAGDYTITPSKTGCSFQPGSISLKALAADKSGNDFTGSATAATITLGPASLPGAFVGTPYSAAITASGGTSPYTFSTTSGSLPNGLSLAADGKITGSPTAATANFTVQAKDSTGATGSQSFSIAVSPASTQPSGARLISGASAGAISVGAEGSLYIVSTTGCDNVNGCNPFKYDGANFQNFTGGGSRLAVDPTGTLWLMNMQGGLYKYQSPTSTSSDPQPVSATDVAIGAEGSVYVIGTTGCDANGCAPQKRNGNSYQSVPGTGVRIAVDPNGIPWVIRKDGSIVRYRNSQAQAADPVPAAGSAISISADGAVYIVGNGPCDSNGCTIYKYNGANFDPITGLTGKEIAADRKGILWLVTAKNEIYRYGAVGISGKISDTTGSCSSGVKVSVSATVSVTSANDGTYSLDGLTAGTYTVTPAKSGCTFNPPSRDVIANADSKDNNFTGTPSSTTPLKYTFTFSANSLTRGGPVVVTYNAASATLPDSILSGTTQSPLFFFVSNGTRSANGDWIFSDGGDPHVGMSFTAKTGLNFANAPGVYPNVPATTSFSCNPCVGDTQASSVDGTVNIVISATNAPAITLGPASLSDATANTAYSVQLTASGGISPYTYKVSSGSLPAGLNLSASGLLNGTPTQVATASFTITATDGVGASGQLAYNLKVVSGAALPTITSVLNGASFVTGGAITPGAWVSVFGTNLAPAGTSRLWRNSEFSNGKFPTNLDGTTVTVNGKPAAVEFIQPSQVNIQAPDDTAVGPVQVVVTTPAGASNAFTVNLATVAPGFFPATAPFIVAQHANNSYVTSGAPARPGEVIILWATGFGATNPPVPSGQVVSGANKLANNVTVTIGGQTATIDFVGVVGAGLVQLNVRVPNGLPNGNTPVVATVGGVTTQTTNNVIQVQN